MTTQAIIAESGSGSNQGTGTMGGNERDGSGGLGVEFERRAADMAMRWYGWGSPVGLGLFLVAAGSAALLISRAIFG